MCLSERFGPHRVSQPTPRPYQTGERLALVSEDKQLTISNAEGDTLLQVRLNCPRTDWTLWCCEQY